MNLITFGTEGCESVPLLTIKSISDRGYAVILKLWRFWFYVRRRGPDCIVQDKKWIFDCQFDSRETELREKAYLQGIMNPNGQSSEQGSAAR